VIQKTLFVLLLLQAPLLAAQDNAEPPPMPPPEPESGTADQSQVPPREGEQQDRPAREPAAGATDERKVPLRDDEQPDMPPPTVTIRREEGKTVEEYSVNGNVYMVRVTPKDAPPYVLVDTDGDGQLQRTDSEIGPHVIPPHWVLFEWE
jgi:hypothetical protein